MLAYGSMRELTDEELARAIRSDPSQIAGLGPSLDMLRGMLLERKRKILATYETEQVQAAARKEFHGSAASVHPPKPLADRFKRAVAEEQLRELERLWYHAGDDRDRFARQLMRLVARLGREVSGRRAGGQVCIHRPHAHDRAASAGDQGRAGDDRPAAEAVGRGGQDGPDRHHRPRGIVAVHRSRAGGTGSRRLQRASKR